MIHHTPFHSFGFFDLINKIKSFILFILKEGNKVQNYSPLN